MSQTKAQLIDNLVQPITGAAGSASAPTFSFTADPNTGIYSPGADQVAVATNSVGRLLIGSGGTVTQTLAAANNNGFAINNGTNDLIAIGTGGFAANGGSVTDGGIRATNSLVFATGSGAPERLRITSAGLVGIGTSAPSNTFTLKAAAGLVNDSDLPSASALIKDSGSSRRIGLGTSSTGNWIQSSQPGVAGVAYPLFLNPLGGSVGIGTTSPGAALDVVGELYAGNGTITNYLTYSVGNSTGIVGTKTNHAFEIRTNNVERCRVDTSGRLLVGMSSARNVGSTLTQLSYLQIESAASTLGGGINVTANRGDSLGASINLAKSKAAAVGGVSILAANDEIGIIRFAGADGVDLESTAASIQASVDGTPGANNMPGRLVFSTTADGASSPTERMRITSTGTVKLNAPTYTSTAQLQLDAKDTTAYAPPSLYPSNQIELQNSVSMGSAIMRFRTQSNNGSAGIWGVGAVPRTSNLKSDFIFQSRTADSTYSEIARFSGDGGILFNGDTTAANALDDYEEGTWTPIIVGRSVSGTTTNNRAAEGRYRKIGSVVHVLCDVDQNVTGASGDFQINGLPFIAHSGPYVRFAGPLIFFNTYGNVTWSGSIVSYINDGATFIWLRGNQSGSSAFTPEIGSGRREIVLNLTYYVNG
jgi:hypothetical protein